MNISGKTCDGADWFVPDIERVVRDDLHELPRFHRKQWEFALVFLILQQRQILARQRIGLSMGGGRERLSYAVAQHVKELFITDLYDPHTMWETARTDDHERFIKSELPFPVDPSKLKVLRMDMRQLEFLENSFDFCYSCCAIEHIGRYEDFLAHLREVYRVLKEGGLYVFTTELHYGSEVIRAPNNYIFSAEYLNHLFSESDLKPEVEFNAAIRHHRINYPIPVNLYSWNPGSYLSDAYPHIQLLAGKHPFSSAVFVLHKDQTRSRSMIHFRALKESKQFLDGAIEEYRHYLERSRIQIDPYAALPNHAPTADTLFHTAYIWFGSGRRSFEVRCLVTDITGPCVIELRLHRYYTLNQASIEPAATVRVNANHSGQWIHSLEATVADDCCYAFLAQIIEGHCRIENVETRTSPL